MNSAETERLRLSLLQQLHAVGDATLPISVLVTGARLAGFTAVAEETVRFELAYLCDKGLAAAPVKLLSPEVKRWRITAAGRDCLAEQGL